MMPKHYSDTLHYHHIHNITFIKNILNMGKIVIQFLSFITIQLVVTLIVGAVMTAINGNSDVTATTLTVSSAASSILTVVLFCAMKWCPFSREYIQQKPWGVMFWCVVLTFGILIPSQWLTELLPDAMTTDILSDTFKMILGTPNGYFAVGLLAPLAEEVVFRGAIQRRAISYFERKMGVGETGGNGQKTSETPRKSHSDTTIAAQQQAMRANLAHWMGIVMTAILFALVHGNPAQMPNALLVGLLLGWLCYRSGSIVPGLVVHFVNNTTAYVLYNLNPATYDMHLIDFFGGEQTRLYLALLFSLLIFLPALYQLHLRTKK